jgi:hypothetical protein
MQNFIPSGGSQPDFVLLIFNYKTECITVVVQGSVDILVTQAKCIVHIWKSELIIVFFLYAFVSFSAKRCLECQGSSGSASGGEKWEKSVN